MKIIEVPVFNEDGSIKFTQVVSPEEAQYLLQFAINFLSKAGAQMRMIMATPDDVVENKEEQTLELND